MILTQNFGFFIYTTTLFKKISPDLWVDQPSKPTTRWFDGTIACRIWYIGQSWNKMNEEDQYFVLFFMPTLKIYYIDFKYNVIWRKHAEIRQENSSWKFYRILDIFQQINTGKQCFLSARRFLWKLFFIILYVLGISQNACTG